MSAVQLSLEAAAAIVRGVLRARGSGSFTGVTIDSREVKPGMAFVAIAGDRQDGHSFWQQAAGAGAAALIVSRPLAGMVPPGVAVIEVPDTRLALGQLARAWRRELAPKVVAITGSVGKTTTKELTRAMLAESGMTHSTPGNFNNDLGLPLTLLGMERGTTYLVAEMGMNHPGEISYLARLAEPDVGVITCIAPVHLEGLGSMAAIAAAKAELLLGLGPAGRAVVPSEEPLLEPWLPRVADRTIHFGDRPVDEVQLLGVQCRGTEGSDVRLRVGKEEISFRLPLLGAHHARNAAAAAAVGHALGLPTRATARALSRAPELKHRSVLRTIGPWQVLDDCYNASPIAMKAALDTLRQLAGDRPAIAVLGDMLELGAGAEALHQEAGRHAAGTGLQLLITVGTLGAVIGQGAIEAGMDRRQVVGVAAAEEASHVLRQQAVAGAWILVKASRGAHLERIIDALSPEPGRGRSSGEGEDHP